MKEAKKGFSTAAEIKALPVGDHFDRTITGLCVRVRESGRRTWALMYRVRGRLRRWTIGTHPPVSLAEARQRANAALLEVRNGGDPAAKKKDARTAKTFGDLAERYIEEWAQPRKRRWKRDQSALAAYVLPHWKNRPIREITRADVRSLLKGIPGEIFPNRIRALLSKVFSFAVTEELADANPVVGTPRKPEHKRERVLTDEEIRKVWATEDPILRLILATGPRPDDVKGARRSEIADGTWTIPAERFKTKRAHTVPLAELATDILDAIPQLDKQDAFFTQRQAKGLISTLATAGVPDARPKDLQRTVRSRLGALDVSPDVAERLQGHVIPGVRDVYDKHDYATQKRAALVRWSEELRRIVAGTKRKGKLLRVR